MKLKLTLTKPVDLKKLSGEIEDNAERIVASHVAYVEQQFADCDLQRQAHQQAARHVYEAVAVLMESPADESAALDACDALLRVLVGEEGE
jgi:hypothetical protein